MIVEMRTYTFLPGKVQEYLRLYEEEGMPIQRSILGNMLGYFTTEIGPLNQVIHLWGYESLEDRSRRRAELQAHSGWQAYVAKIRPLLQAQESRILLPTRFSPIQ